MDEDADVESDPEREADDGPDVDSDADGADPVTDANSAAATDADADATEPDGEADGADVTNRADETDRSDGANVADRMDDTDGADVADPAEDADRSDAADAGGAAPGVPDEGGGGNAHATADVPEDVRKYARFKKMDGAQYERVNEFLRDRTYITAREWAIARLCSDFRTETGVEMTKIGEHLPQLVPFMTDTYTPQAVNQARSAFDEKVRKAGATFLYGAMCDFYTAEELDDVMYEVTEVAKFLLEVEGVDLTVEEELEAEERISSVMRDVRAASQELREEEVATDDSAPSETAPPAGGDPADDAE